MTMTIWQGAITIVTVVLGTMCTRFLPFLVFPESKQPPRIIEYFGQVLPYAMTGLLVVYALRNTPILTGSHGLPELIACTVIVLLHVWKRNRLLSIAGGTIVAFRCLVWVSGSGGGGAGRVVWGYGYHVVVHRRPATA